MHNNSKRNICKHCQRIWLPDNSGDSGFRIVKRGRKLFKICTDCQHIKIFVMDPNYKSRNEKT